MPGSAAFIFSIGEKFRLMGQWFDPAPTITPLVAYSPPPFLFRGSRRACKRLMALARHLQHANIEDDTSRHAGQFECPQRRQVVVRKGHSLRFVIGWPGYFHSLRLVRNWKKARCGCWMISHNEIYASNCSWITSGRCAPHFLATSGPLNPAFLFYMVGLTQFL